MATSHHSLIPTNSTTFDSSSSSSSSSSPPSSSMETEPSRPFFFGRRVFEKKTKRAFIMIKKRYPHEETDQESEGSIESSPPCVFFISKKKPANSTTESAGSSSAAIRKRKERDLDNSFDAAKNKLVNLADTPTESVLETKNSGGEEVVSTELTLFHGLEINNGVSSGSLSRKKSVSDNFLAPNLAFFKSCRCGCDEEQGMGISTELRLYNDPWVLKKTLKRSDIGHLARLLVETKLVLAHILPSVGSVRANQIHNGEGLRVTLLDLDTGSEHGLIFKKWLKPSSYVFLTGWRNQFVKRRGLQKGDEIGLFWDGYSSRFYFRVLALAAVPLAQGNMIE